MDSDYVFQVFKYRACRACTLCLGTEARENARRRAEKGVSGRASKEGRRVVGPSEGAGLRKAVMRSERCAAVIRTSLGCCMRCAQLAAGESPPNPKVQHVHYDTGPRVTGNRRACCCCGAPARKRPVFQISQNIAHPGRTENSTPGPMSVLPRQFNQRSYRSVVEYMRGAERAHTASPSAGGRPSSGRWEAGEFVQALAHRADRANIPKRIRCPELRIPC